jgi:hypothetical protein
MQKKTEKQKEKNKVKERLKSWRNPFIMHEQSHIWRLVEKYQISKENIWNSAFFIS